MPAPETLTSSKILTNHKPTIGGQAAFVPRPFLGFFLPLCCVNCEIETEIERTFIIIVIVIIIIIKSNTAIHRLVLSEALDQLRLLHGIRLPRCFNLRGVARRQKETNSGSVRKFELRRRINWFHAVNLHNLSLQGAQIGFESNQESFAAHISFLFQKRTIGWREILDIYSLVHP